MESYTKMLLMVRSITVPKMGNGNMKKILITGGAGFIGGYVVEELASRGYDSIIFDHLGRGPHEEVKMPAERVIGDIRDATAVTEATAHADGVIHLAGILGTQETIDNPRPAAETNILGALNILEACAQYHLPLVNIAVGNWPEYSTYPITKHTGERFTEMYRRHRAVSAVSVRVYNAYGPRQAVAAPYGSSRVRKVIPSFITRALHDDPIEVYGDGSQVMDMIHVTDAAKALVNGLESAAAGTGNGLFEAGTARATDVAEIARLVAHEVHLQTGLKVQVKHKAMRPGETPGSTVLSPVAFPDAVRLEDGLRDTVTYYRKLFST